MIHQPNSMIERTLFKFNFLIEPLEPYRKELLPLSFKISSQSFPLTPKLTASERFFSIYLEEIKQHINQLNQYLTQDKNKKEFKHEKIIFLLNLIQQQFAVLYQAKNQLLEYRNKKQAKKAKLILPYESLHQRQVRYRGYLEKLKQQQEDLMLSPQNWETQKKIKQFNERIQKCKSAILDLDYQIERQEKSFE